MRVAGKEGGNFFQGSAIFTRKQQHTNKLKSKMFDANSRKINIEGGLHQKEGWTVYRFKGGRAWQERGGVSF